MDVFDLYAKVSLDTSEYKKSVSDVSSSGNKLAGNLSDSASKAGKSWADAFADIGKKAASAFATVGKVTAAGVGTATAAIGALSKASLDAYSSYEQLTGGVETLFDSSASKVIEYADNAYKTAGLSANEYMETVTSFSASLLQSLGNDTESAAEKADLAITDMSDNANKMGTSMEMIQNAYQGFAKANYTMLDNLKLGYGGTKEEMQRLLEDAQAISGVHYDLSSFSDIVDAIHVIQTELGITGTTAKEAATTIEGSVNSAKSAWTNLITGIADENADLDGLVSNFVDSATTAANNIIPRIEQILSGMGNAIANIAPVLTDQVSSLATELLPPMVSAGAQLFAGLVTGIVNAAPQLVNTVPQIAQSLISAFQASAPSLMASGQTVVTMLGAGITSGLPLLATNAAALMTNFGAYLQQNLPTLMQTGLEVVSGFSESLRENAGTLVDGALSLAKSLAQGLADSIPTIVENVPEIVTNIAGVINDNAPKVLVAAGQIILTLAKGLIEAIPTIVQNLPQIINAIVNVILAFNWLDLGKSIIEGLANGVKAAATFVKDAAGQIVSTVKTGISKLPGEMLTIGKQVIQGLINGIKGALGGLKDNALSIAKGVVSVVKNALGIHSPSKVFEDIGNYIMQGLEIGMKDGSGNVMQTADDIAKELETRFSHVQSVLENQKNIAETEYDLWESTIGASATESEKLTKKLESLSDQQEIQTEVVEAAQTAYDKIVEVYGEASAEAIEYKKTLLEEKSALVELQTEIDDTSNALSKATDETEQFKTALDTAFEETNNFGSAISSLGSSASDLGDVLGIDLVSDIGAMISKMGGGISSVINFANSLIQVANSVSTVTSALSNLASIASTVSSGGGLLSTIGSIFGGSTGVLGTLALGGAAVGAVGTAEIIKDNQKLWNDESKSFGEKLFGTISNGLWAASGVGTIIKGFETIFGKKEKENALEDSASNVQNSIKDQITTGTVSGVTTSGGDTIIERVEIFIEGSQYKDEDSLAEAISIKLQNLTERKVNVFA